MKWTTAVVLFVVSFFGVRMLWRQHLALVAAHQDLTAQRRGIERTEGELVGLDRTIDQSELRIRELAGKVSAIEREHPGGIPQAIYPDYKRLVDEHNDAVASHNVLVARHGELREQYATRVDRHNHRVDEANSEATEGSGCAILPGPIRRWACNGAEP